MIKNLLQQLYLSKRFFIGIGICISLFAISFAFSFVFYVALVALIGLCCFTVFDIMTLFHQRDVLHAERETPNLFSLGDAQLVKIKVENRLNQPLAVDFVDELPFQLNVRDFEHQFELEPLAASDFNYNIRPTQRGELNFGNLHFTLQTNIGLVERKYVVNTPQSIPVYPSILQMKQFELQAFTRISSVDGVKKMRRIGHSYEFEQIKPYVRGDDYRSINWKATSRRNDLMVNQYEDEKSQPIYSIIDKSRKMKMPFSGMSLMDYAINTTLAISNISIKKHDKAGLICFSDKLGHVISADRGKGQLQKIMRALYKEKERFEEANFELLYHALNKWVTTRSLLFLYTNFDSLQSLQKVIHILKQINKRHLLVLVLFENEELEEFSNSKVDNLRDIYHTTIAQKAVVEKTQIVHTLRHYGIQAIVTKPQELSLSTINKYMELKARGMI